MAAPTATASEPCTASNARAPGSRHKLLGLLAPLPLRLRKRLPQIRLLSLLPWLPVALIGLLCFLPALAWAQSGSPGPAGLPLVVAQGAGGTSYSVPIQTLLFFTALSFLPAVLLLMTAFTRIVIVLSLLRQALGTQAAPPNQVIIGLSLFMTFFVMGPAMDKIYTQAWQPYAAGTLPAEQALAEGIKPLREFMLKQTRQSDVALFSKLAKLPAGTKAEDLPLTVLVPSFVTSELKSAFQIGFMIFIPFLIIDMIVASVLMSLGMMMLSPVLVALPFKLMLFVLADGWNLLLGSLAASFAT
jgi:flagellar biosynthesis protein FliP